jgi:hypothetical protein
MNKLQFNNFLTIPLLLFLIFNLSSYKSFSQEKPKPEKDEISIPVLETLNIKSPNVYSSDDLSITNPQNIHQINSLAFKHYSNEQILAMTAEKVFQINWLYSDSYIIIVKGKEPIDVFEINNRDFEKRKIIDYKDSKIELLSQKEVDIFLNQSAQNIK